MGNLRQEHNYNTDDVPGGLGIAQWLGARRARIMTNPHYLDYQVQLGFIVEELQSTEAAAMQGLKSSTSVEEATVAFQNLYERCGNCKQSQRIQYAYEVLGRH